MSAFVRASSYALEMQPIVNAVIDEKEIVYRDYVDISVAVATPRVRIVDVDVNYILSTSVLLSHYHVVYGCFFKCMFCKAPYKKKSSRCAVKVNVTFILCV